MDERVRAINERLKGAGLSVRVRLHGRSLSLQATLPVKNGEGKKQQEISLGVRLSTLGLKRIESEAHLLARHLANGTFRWELYQAEKVDKPNMAQDVLERFKADYLLNNRIKESTWEEYWASTLLKLPQDEPITEANLLAVILTTASHSRIREQTVQRLSKLAQFAGIQIDLKRYQGDYGERSLKPRDLPTDSLILEWREQIPNATWQWVYGMMAAYGLRPHECWFCEFDDKLVLRVLEGKTGSHTARPLMPEWVDDWSLKTMKRPPVMGDRYKVYGQRTYTQFCRYAMPFNPYDLRHAYAVRGIRLGLPPQVMAHHLGHSIEIHTRTYNRWMGDAVAAEVYERVLKPIRLTDENNC